MPSDKAGNLNSLKQLHCVLFPPPAITPPFFFFKQPFPILSCLSFNPPCLSGLSQLPPVTSLWFWRNAPPPPLLVKVQRVINSSPTTAPFLYRKNRSGTYEAGIVLGKLRLRKFESQVTFWIPCNLNLSTPTVDTLPFSLFLRQLNTLFVLNASTCTNSFKFQ